MSTEAIVWMLCDIWLLYCIITYDEHSVLQLLVTAGNIAHTPSQGCNTILNASMQCHM